MVILDREAHLAQVLHGIQREIPYTCTIIIPSIGGKAHEVKQGLMVTRIHKKISEI